MALRLLALLTICGTLLRLLGLDWQSLWLDEVSSLRNAHAFGAGGLAGLAKADQIAPLHSMVLWLFTSIGGDSAISVRLPSVIGGILLVPFVYLVVVRMFQSRSAALFSAALIAISPFAIWYSQEGRMYALLLLATVAYVAIAWPIVSRPLTWRELLLLGIVTLFGFGMHHYMALVCASFGLFLLVQQRGLTKRVWAWTATQLVAALIFSYWMVLTADRIGGAAGNEKPGFLLWTPYTFYSFLVGFTFGPSTDQLALAGKGLITTVLAYAPAVATLAIAAAILMILGVRIALRLSVRGAALWLLMWLFVPIMLAILATFVTNIQFNVRYVIMSFPALLILLGLALSGLPWAKLVKQLRGRKSELTATAGDVGPADLGSTVTVASSAAAVVLVVCLSIATVNLYANQGYAKADVRSLAAYLKKKPGRVLLLTDNNRVVKVLGYYGAPVPPTMLQVDYRHTWMSPQVVWNNVRLLPPTIADEIWFVEYRSWEADPQHFLRTRLDHDMRLIDVHAWPGVAVRRYRFENTARGSLNG